MIKIFMAIFLLNFSFVTNCVANDAVYLSKVKKVRAVFTQDYLLMYATGRGEYYEKKPIWKRSLSNCGTEKFQCVISDRFLFAVPVGRFKAGDTFLHKNYEIKIEKCLDSECESSIISTTCLNWRNAECSAFVPGVMANKIKFSSYLYNLHSGIEWIKLIGDVNLKVDGHVRLFQEAR